MRKKLVHESVQKTAGSCLSLVSGPESTSVSSMPIQLLPDKEGKEGNVHSCKYSVEYDSKPTILSSGSLRSSSVRDAGRVALTKYLLQPPPLPEER